MASLLIPSFYDYENHVHPRSKDVYVPAFKLPLVKDDWIGHCTFADCVFRRIAVTIPNANPTVKYAVEIGKWVAGKSGLQLEVLETFDLKPWENTPLVYITDEINWSSSKLKDLKKMGFCIRAGQGYTSDYYFDCDARFSAGLDFVRACVRYAPSAKTDEVTYSTHNDLELKNGRVPHLITAYVAYTGPTSA